METHVLDAGYLLLETHAAEAASLIRDFVRLAPGTTKVREAE